MITDGNAFETRAAVRLSQGDQGEVRGAAPHVADQHLLTVGEVIGHFTDRPIHIEGELSKPGAVRVTGAVPEW